MPYKDLLVVLDSGPRLRERVVLAAALADRFHAHLTGLHVGPSPEYISQLGFAAPMSLDRLYRKAEEYDRQQTESNRRLFDDIAGRHSLLIEFRPAVGYPAEVASAHGRYADLIILGQLDPSDPPGSLVRSRPEEVAILAGRPILVVPYAGNFIETGRCVLVGWDASREATRAINDAMPLLQAAQSVTVIAIDAEQSASGDGEVPGADITLHLARHGVRANLERTFSAGIGIGNTLLSRAADLGADLLVIGAYGHSRVRELLLGGATRTVLGSMTLPVLMSH